MPLYDYKCGKCNHSDEEYKKMDNAAPVIECPKCGAFEYVKAVSLPHTDLHEFHTPVELYSIAMEDLDEVRAFKRQCPDVDLSDDPADPLYGVPVARSRKAKLQALSAAGFTERS